MWSDVYLLDAGGARWRLSVSEWWYWYRDLHTGQYLLPQFIYLQPLFKTISALWMLCLYLRMHGSAQSAENTTYLSRGTVFGAGL